jgi:SNF2 family DNA or RNA helicase
LATRGPFLVIAPLSTIPHWYREFTGWTDLNTIVYHGSAEDRVRAREDEFAFPQDQVDSDNVGFNQRYLNKVQKKWRSKWERTWMVEVVITTPEMLGEYLLFCCARIGHEAVQLIVTFRFFSCSV